MEEYCKVSDVKSKKVRFIFEGKEVFCSGSTDNTSKKNVEEAVNKASWDGRKLNFKTKSNKDLKRFLKVILVYNFFNNCFIVNI